MSALDIKTKIVVNICMCVPPNMANDHRRRRIDMYRNNRKKKIDGTCVASRRDISKAY